MRYVNLPEDTFTAEEALAQNPNGMPMQLPPDIALPTAANMGQLPPEMEASAPELPQSPTLPPAPAAAQAPTEPNKLQQLLEAYNQKNEGMGDELKLAQSDRSDQLKNLAMIGGFNQLGAAMAGSQYNPENLKSLEGLANQPVADIEERQKQSKASLEDRLKTYKELRDQSEEQRKAEKHPLEMKEMDMKMQQAAAESQKIMQAVQSGQIDLARLQQMADPSSDISTAYRQLASKHYGQEIPEGTSALELVKSNIKLADPSARAAAVKQYMQKGVNPKTGEAEFFSTELTPGQEPAVKFMGIKPSYADVLRTDPRTGEVIKVNRGTGSVENIETGATPGEQKPGKTNYEKLPPKYAKDIDDQVKSFGDESKNNKEALEKIQGIMPQVDMALKNPVSFAQLKAEVARVYEKGVLTDADVDRYVKDPSLAGKIKQTVSSVANGTITPSTAKYLKQSLELQQRVLDDRMEDDAQKAVSRVTAKHAIPDEDVYKFMRPEAAAALKAMPPKDQDAVKWARKHVLDPKEGAKARQILKLHGL